MAGDVTGDDAWSPFIQVWVANSSIHGPISVARKDRS